ncbi:MAG TPA: hypothetical protein VK745_19185, partial [Polyangiaceae bacterium]|nr:hypothetical protein [Polyangiaceae bacterium]
RFPEHKEVWMMNAAGPNGQVDLAPLVQLGERMQRRTRDAEELYRNNPLSVWLFGRALGEDEICAAIHLAASEQAVRCCVGSEAEDRASLAAFDAASEVVVDSTTIATILLLDHVDILESFEKQIVLSHGTFFALTAFARGASKAEKPERVSIDRQRGPAFVTAPAEVKARAVETATRLVSLASKRWRIVACRELAELPQEQRKRLFEVFGEAAVESAAIASALPRVLWSDDAVVGAMASQQFGARRIWTQSLFRRLLSSRAIDEEEYIRASAGLVAARYHFTSATPEILRRAAQWAKWSPAQAPMPEVLGYLTSPFTKPADAANLGAALIALAYRDPALALPEQHRTTVIAIAEAIGKRQDGPRSVRLMRAVLERSFGLDVVGCADALRTLVVWSAESERRVRLLK